VSKLQKQRVSLELAFLSEVSSSLSKEQASAFAAALKPDAELTSTEPGAGAPDALSALEGFAAAAREQTKHVWVLRFFGDVTASQVSSLRQEVTATLRAADAARGDAVVLVLNTGGGTVTGCARSRRRLTPTTLPTMPTEHPRTDQATHTRCSPSSVCGGARTCAQTAWRRRS
jgi:ClpP class serine protease